MHIRDSLVRAGKKREVEPAEVVQVADDPGALAGDLDGHGPVRESAVFQAWSARDTS